MEIILNTYGINKHTTFRNAKNCIKQPLIKQSNEVKKLYQNSEQFLENKIDKSEYLNQFFKFYKNILKKPVKLNRNENIFIANIMMNLDLFSPCELPEELIKKDVKIFIDGKNK